MDWLNLSALGENMDVEPTESRRKGKEAWVLCPLVGVTPHQEQDLNPSGFWTAAPSEGKEEETKEVSQRSQWHAPRGACQGRGPAGLRAVRAQVPLPLSSRNDTSLHTLRRWGGYALGKLNETGSGLRPHTQQGRRDARKSGLCGQFFVLKGETGSRLHSPTTGSFLH